MTIVGEFPFVVFSVLDICDVPVVVGCERLLRDSGSFLFHKAIQIVVDELLFNAVKITALIHFEIIVIVDTRAFRNTITQSCYRIDKANRCVCVIFRQTAYRVRL